MSDGDDSAAGFVVSVEEIGVSGLWASLKDVSLRP
jgi:hypothetical protein